MLVKAGDIIHAFIEDIYPPKYKYLLCVHPENRLFLTINTEDREMYRCIKILSSNYPFLKGIDRFISSNNFFIISRTTIDKCKILDTLNKEDKLRIYNKIQEAPKISMPDKLLSKVLLS
ncbi:hypothetical protein Megpolyxen_01907 (plasmid) [Candidatus Megaera polyxenophila]|nr:hypothetical protein Megpolyxen_01907 [Candidatus Megaera polyxenophila]